MFDLLIILENTLTSLYFFIEYYKKKRQRPYKYLRDKQDTEDILNKCKNIYYIDTFNRYIFYLCVSICMYILSFILKFENYFLLKFCIGFIVINPAFQYNIFIFFDNEIKYINNIKTIFLKYFVTSTIVSLFYGMLLRRNMQIKIKFLTIKYIYKHIDKQFIINLIQEYLAIILLYYLRSGKNTYNYYKLLKTGYYSYSGIYFNSLTKDQSLHVIGISNELDFNFINGFYVITAGDTNILHTIQFYILKLFSLWSLITFFSYYNKQINNNILLIYIIILLSGIYYYYIIELQNSTNNEILKQNNDLHIKKNSSKNILKNIEKILIILILLYYNINDFIISLAVLLHSTIKFFIRELNFFIKHYDIITLLEKNDISIETDILDNRSISVSPTYIEPLYDREIENSFLHVENYEFL